jgi:hypothetical protein
MASPPSIAAGRALPSVAGAVGAVVAVGASPRERISVGGGAAQPARGSSTQANALQISAAGVID